MFLSLLGYKLKLKKEKSLKKKEEVKLKGFRIEKGKYETDFDILYKLVQKKGSIKLSDIEKYFKINKKLAEEWCLIMENHGLLEFYYPPFGEPELRRKDETGKRKSRKT